MVSEYNTSLYYGILINIDEAPMITALLESSIYSKCLTSKSDQILSLSNGSHFAIYVDDMISTGLISYENNLAAMGFYPSELIKSEKKFAEEVDLMTDIEGYLRKELILVDENPNIINARWFVMQTERLEN